MRIPAGEFDTGLFACKSLLSAQTKKQLTERLSLMAEDIEIGGVTNFKAIAVALVIAGGTAKPLLAEYEKDAERLLKRADRLLGDLIDFWDRHPELDRDNRTRDKFGLTS